MIDFLGAAVKREEEATPRKREKRTKMEERRAGTEMEREAETEMEREAETETGIEAEIGTETEAEIGTETGQGGEAILIRKDADQEKGTDTMGKQKKSCVLIIIYFFADLEDAAGAGVEKDVKIN